MSNNQITELDVSSNVALEELILSSNQLTSFNIDNNNDLFKLTISNNPLNSETIDHLTEQNGRITPDGKTLVVNL